MRDSKMLLKLLRLQLQGDPPAAPILKLALAADPSAPRVAQGGLFIPQGPDPEKLELTIARLANLVGDGNIGSPRLVDTHRPGEFRMRRFLPLRRSGKADTEKHAKPRLGPASACSGRLRRPAWCCATDVRRAFLFADCAATWWLPPGPGAHPGTGGGKTRGSRMSGIWKFSSLAPPGLPRGAGEKERARLRQKVRIAGSIASITTSVCRVGSCAECTIDVHRASCPLRFQFSRRRFPARGTGQPYARNTECQPWLCSIATASTARRVFIWLPGKLSLRAHIGAEVTSAAGWRYPLLVESRAGYQNLCRLITRMKLRARKGEGAYFVRRNR